MSFTKEQSPSLHRFSLEQYYEFGELGLLDRRTELLDGIIIDMESVSPWHANIGDILSRILNEGARGRFRVRVQYPINLGQMSQPQPDLVLYRPGYRATIRNGPMIRHRQTLLKTITSGPRSPIKPMCGRVKIPPVACGSVRADRHLCLFHNFCVLNHIDASS